MAVVTEMTDELGGMSRMGRVLWLAESGRITACVFGNYNIAARKDRTWQGDGPVISTDRQGRIVFPDSNQRVRRFWRLLT